MNSEDPTHTQNTGEQRGSDAELYRLVVEQAADGIFLSDRLGNYINVNDSACQMLGYTREEILQLNMRAVIAPQDLTVQPIHFAQLWAGETVISERELLRKDGTTFPVEISGKALSDGRMLGIVRDITARRAAERRGVSLNQTYAALSEVNQTILRTRDMPVLFVQICQIAVEIGRYHLAWIGLLDEASGQLRLAAHSGDSQLVDAALRDETRSYAAVINALRANQPVICAALQNDANLLPWQKLALETGCRSAAVFPLFSAGNFRGSLNLYAAEPDYFSPDIIRILDELALDVSFAIEFSEQETQRQLAEEAVRIKDELLRQTGSLAHVGGWEFDAATLQGSWTDEVARIHDLDPNQPTNVALGISFYTPESRAKIDRAIQDALTLAKPYDLELEMLTAAGNHKWVHTIGTPLLADGKVIKVTGIFQDISEQKNKEAEIQALAKFPAENLNPVLRFGPDGLLIYANKASADLLAAWNCSVGAVLPEPWNGLVIEASRTGALHERQVDCGERIFSLQFTPIRGENYVNAYGRDITERLRAERALQESQRNYQLLVENASDVIWILDLQTMHFRYVSPSVVALRGYSVEEILAQDASAALTPASALRLEQNLPQRLQEFLQGNDRSYTDLMDQPHRDGSIISTETRTRYKINAENGHIEVYGVSRDISERKRWEQELLENEERYRTVADYTYDWEYWLSPQGAVKYISPSCERISGYSREEFIAHPALFDEIVHPNDQSENQQHQMHTLDPGQENSVHEVDFRILRKDGNVRWIGHTCRIIRRADGTSLGRRATNRDITERKLAEDQIRILNMGLEQRVQERTLQLEKANQELEAFTYSVSHDLRAPLRGIDGWSHILLEDYYDQLNPQGRESLNFIRSETKRMGLLIENLLQFSRISRSEMQPAQVDLSALAQIVIERLQRDQPHPFIEVILQPGLSAYGDSALLEILLTNLLSNAWKFSAGRADARIELGQTQVDAKSVFFVRDNGVGFDMAYAAKLFGVFQRMHKVSEFPGTGIGLAMVQRIAQRHGGEVWAQAQVHQGATFFFTLKESI
jgi:PAS domain S-box-containing protein